MPLSHFAGLFVVLLRHGSADFGVRCQQEHRSLLTRIPVLGIDLGETCIHYTRRAFVLYVSKWNHLQYTYTSSSLHLKSLQSSTHHSRLPSLIIHRRRAQTHQHVRFLARRSDLRNVGSCRLGRLPENLGQAFITICWLCRPCRCLRGIALAEKPLSRQELQSRYYYNMVGNCGFGWSYR